MNLEKMRAENEQLKQEVLAIRRENDDLRDFIKGISRNILAKLKTDEFCG